MTNQIGRSERTTVGGAIGGPCSTKEASPLQREINDLKATLDHQSKTIEDLTNKLKPLWLDSPASDDSKEAPDPTMSEIPTQVRSCRKLAVTNTELIQWLINRVEV